MLSMLRLKCLVKRKEALRGRNLSREIQVEGAPRVHPTSGVHVASGSFSAHPLDTFAMPPKIQTSVLPKRLKLLRRVHLDWLLFGFISWAESCLPSSIAEARRCGGWIHLFAVTGPAETHVGQCFPG